MWTVQLLGGLTVVGPQQQVVTRFRTQKAASLLAYLAFHGGPAAAHSREVLLEVLWPEADLDAGRHNLSNALSVLRRVLEPAGVPPGSVILADYSAVRLSPTAVRTDVAAFEEAVGKSADPSLPDAAREQFLLEAAELYRGPLLPGYYEDWIPMEAARLSGMCLRALAQLIPRLLAGGRLEAALAHAQRAVAEDPLNEGATQHLMQVLAASGAPSHAQRIYHLLEQRLEAAGTEPSPPLKEYAAGLRSHAPLPVEEMGKWGNEETGERDAAISSSPHFPIAPSPDGGLRGEANLLLTSTRFFDRESETAQLSAMLRAPRTRLVTLTGGGGTGKTRLALEVANGLAMDQEAPADALYVPLADVTEAGRLYETILRAAGVLPGPRREPLEQLAEVLASRPHLLLILDNFEQLVDDGALLVRRLLAAAPHVRLLVTSRQKLRIEGEHEFHLAPLPTTGGARSPDDLLRIPSIALFADRAEASLPGFELGERHAAAVGELCDRLEGIPLAIELAAARVSVLSPEHILKQVTANRLDFLATQRRDAESRHRTLRAALDWSYLLLPEEGQRFLAQLSVFRGGWTVEAAEAIADCGMRIADSPDCGMRIADCGLENARSPNPQSSQPAESGRFPNPQSAIRNPQSEVLELLMLLRDSSLIGVVDTAAGLRFTLLETVREYATERLERSDEREAIRGRHALFFLRLAEAAFPRLTGSEQAIWLDRLENEHDNMRAALAWGLSKAQAREQSAVSSRQSAGDTETPSPNAERRRPNAEIHPSSFCLRMAGALRPFWEVRGYLTEGRSHLGAALKLEPPGNDPRRRTTALAGAAMLAWMQGDYPAATALFEEHLAINRALDDKRGIAWSVHQLGHMASEQGEYDTARELHQEALPILRALGDQHAVGWSVFEMGIVARKQGDCTAARALHEESLAIFRELGNQTGIAVVLNNLGKTVREQGDYETARKLHAGSLEIRRALNDRVGVAWSLEAFACLCVPVDPARAVRLWAAAETLRHTLGVPLPPNERAEYDRDQAAVRETLGEVFAREWAAGQAMTIDEAVACALDSV